MKSLIIALLVVVGSLVVVDSAQAFNGNFVRRHPILFPRAAFIARGGIPTVRSTLFPFAALRRQALGFPQVVGVGLGRQAFFAQPFRQNVVFVQPVVFHRQAFFAPQAFVAPQVFVPRQQFFVQPQSFVVQQPQFVQQQAFVQQPCANCQQQFVAPQAFQSFQSSSMFVY